MSDLFPEVGKKAPVPLDRQIACVTRELAMRRRVYPGWIERKRLTQAAADAEIAAMEAVLATLQRVQVAEANHAERVSLSRAPGAAPAAEAVTGRDEWQPIETAPTDGTLVWVYVAAYEDLPAFQSVCAWHEDAGWCCDELRPVTHWMPLKAVWQEPPPRHRAKGARDA